MEITKERVDADDTKIEYEANLRMRVMLDAMPLAAQIWDKTFHIIDCNQAALNLLKVASKQEFLDKLLDLSAEVQPDGRSAQDAMNHYLHEAFETGYQRLEWLHILPDGELIPCEIILTRIEYNNDHFVAAFIRDLREQNRMMEELERQRMLAERASKAKSEFMSHISHEIRTPMNAILGTAEIQLQKENNPAYIEEAFNTIYTSGNLLLNIINDILDLSSIEAGKLNIRPGNYDIPSIIYDTVQLNLLRAESKPIEFDLKIDKDTPHDLFGDELRIKQIMNNILSNALKYTEEGRVELSISAELIENLLAVEADADVQSDCILVLRISDTGQGMTEAQVEKLFDEYTRFNMDSNRTIAGSGLGMHITKRLIDKMDGEIIVQSTPGKGSVFTVRIPQKRIGTEICGAELADQLRASRFKKMLKLKRGQIVHEYMPYGKILVVDDVESNLYVAKGMLTPYGLKIETVTSGVEAVNRIKNGNVYDIVFMDHMMPQMNGIEATKRIRDMGYAHPVVALTANAVVGSSDLFLSSGFDGYIFKPIDIRELNAVLNRLIRDKQPPEVIAKARRERERQNSTADSEPIQNILTNETMTAAVVRDIEYAIAILDDLLLKQNDLDIELFTTTVHGMKTALANIGEKQLSSMACHLEQVEKNKNINVILSETPEFVKSLQTLTQKIKPKEADRSDGADQISDDDMVFLQEKLAAIKTACERIKKSDAKIALEALKQKTWPRKINDLLDEISEYLLLGKFKMVVACVDKASDIH